MSLVNDDVARSALAGDICKAARGDDAALARIYDLTSAKLNALLMRMLRDEGAAADVLQDVYLTVWQRGAAFDPARGSPVTWLVTIARNKAVDRLRAEAARGIVAAPVDEGMLLDPSPSAVERLEQHQDRIRLLDCLAALEPRQRAAICAAFFDGMTYQAFALRENLPLGTVKSSVRRGLLRLRSCLGS